MKGLRNRSWLFIRESLWPLSRDHILCRHSLSSIVKADCWTWSKNTQRKSTLYFYSYKKKWCLDKQLRDCWEIKSVSFLLYWKKKFTWSINLQMMKNNRFHSKWSLFLFFPGVYCKKSNKKCGKAFRWSYKVVKAIITLEPLCSDM